MDATINQPLAGQNSPRWVYQRLFNSTECRILCQLL